MAMYAEKRLMVDIEIVEDSLPFLTLVLRQKNFKPSVLTASGKYNGQQLGEVEEESKNREK